MPNNEAEALRIFRLLTPEHQSDLLDLVRRAYKAENSTQNPGFLIDRESLLNPQDCPCGNLLKRSEK